jgi:CheY-like chemotaxis protein
VKILVVDDSAAVRFMLTALLEDAGMEVDTASSGTEALDRLAEPSGLDAVVLDQRMPGLTGIEVARLALEREACPKLVLFSAYLHPMLLDEARELGVTTVVKTDLAELVEALEALRNVIA